MTTDAHHPLDMRDRDFLMPPTLAQRKASVERARSHSKFVSRLRYGLPLAALATFGLYFLSPQIHISVGDLDASVAGVVIEKGNLRMVNPKLEGVNDKQGAYVVTAKYAEQTVSNPDFIRLTELSSEMNDAKNGWSRLTSPQGTFETKTEKLQLFGDVRVAQSNGMTARLTKADVDMKTQLVTSDEPVKIDFPNGKLDALTLRIDMDTKRATFKGDVKVHLVQDKKPATANKPDKETQGLAGAFRNDAPVDIAAPRLTIYDERKLAHFEGGVTTVQAGSQMTSEEMKVIYASSPGETAKPAQSASSSAGKLKWIDALGNVQIATQDGRRATAEKLSYDALRQELTLDKNVVLAQGENLMKGERMVSNLASGITRFPPLGRVHGHFKPAEPKTPAKAGNVQAAPAADAGTNQFDLSSTRGKPVDIDADSLIVNDKKRVAVFHGKVKAVQGTMTMRSSKLNVHYAGGSDQTGEASKITSIRAEGKVLINTADDQATTSDWAVFSAADQTVTIGGNVVLSQGDNIIKGDTLVIDLTTNRSRFVNRGSPTARQRVRGLFMPSQSGTQ